jgi:hypothetical protein
MASGKKNRRRKKQTAAGRRKFASAQQIRAQLEGITAAQQRYRRAKRRKTREEETGDARDSQAEGIIIESREKSEQAWTNALRAVRRPEDLDGFD